MLKPVLLAVGDEPHIDHTIKTDLCCRGKQSAAGAGPLVTRLAGGSAAGRGAGHLKGS
ncbi:MAG: hypothetical protein GYA17_09470 [Chloroflexi bacterium]|nr:hypothetical protein [Chloroflexota bacterium]